MRKLIVLQHLEIEGPGLFSKIAKERGIDLKIYHLYIGDILPVIQKGDIILIMGGPMGVRDISSNKFPWLKEELEFIKIALTKKVGIIGICLGAQLLAFACGGEIDILKGGNPERPLPEIGWSQISSKSCHSKDPLCILLKKPMDVLHWHGDRILLPSHAELIASSDRCREQLFKIGPKIYGLQFHAECEKEMTHKWIEADRGFIFSGLGKNGEFILKNQEETFAKKTLADRTKFLNKLMDLVSK